MKLNITERERIYSGYLNIDRLKIVLPNNIEIYRMVIQIPDIVAILAVSSTGEVFLTKQPRAGIDLLESIEIPGGLVNPGELPEIAAERELSEETGCALNTPLISLGKFSAMTSFCTGVSYLYLALDVEQVGELHLDRDEYLECFTKNVEEVYSMLDNGEILDGETIITLMRARKYLQKFGV